MKYFVKGKKGSIIFVTHQIIGDPNIYGINLESYKLNIKSYRAVDTFPVNNLQEVVDKFKKEEYYNTTNHKTRKYFQSITKAIEAMSTIPFHESIVKVIENASNTDLALLTILIKATKIIGNYQMIKQTWQKRTRDMGCQDFGIPDFLDYQEKYCAKK